MKLPRDESAETLIKKLEKVGYKITRQKGSHIRLTKKNDSKDHHITVPNHSPIKIGLLSKIYLDISNNLGITKEALHEILDN